MDIKNEFFPCLLEKGLIPEYHINRLITFTYKENTFSIRPLQNIVRSDTESIVTLSLESTLFTIILYNIHSYDIPNTKRDQMLTIAANINLKYRGIKTIISIENDYHAEIHLELLNSSFLELENNLEKYLDIMILANNEISTLL
ncbi:MAG: hypothetical protein ACK5KT_12160 [Dysgonomonas sp.]